MRSIAITAWLAATCGFKINQMGSDLRTVVVEFWVSKWFWRLKKCGILFGFVQNTDLVFIFLLNLGFFSHLTLDVFRF